MPDAETAIAACNGLRDHLPAIGALAANSPFWFGQDSGMASARAPLFRGYRGAEIPRAFRGYDDYTETIAATVAAGDLADYTFLYWDLRPHPKLGTVEVRARDGQSALWAEAGLAALVHALAALEAQAPRRSSWTPREALVEASFAAHRDGLDARLPLDGGVRQRVRARVDEQQLVLEAQRELRRGAEPRRREGVVGQVRPRGEPSGTGNRVRVA